jgi:hypothetical protein
MLIQRELEEGEENGWYKDNSFSGSDRKSKDKVINDEGRKLISFCETLNFEILNGSREGDATDKITFIAQADVSVIDYIYRSFEKSLCSCIFH